MTPSAPGPWLLLTGMMGAGKSTTGRILARVLGLPFIDLDDAITQRMGEPLHQLLARQGEPAFRMIETETLLELIASRGQKPLIVALGGGTYVQPGAPERLRHAGLTVYLNASQDELERRLDAHQRAARPLLASSPAALQELLQARQPRYALADLHLPVDGRTPHQVAADLLDALPRNHLPCQSVTVPLQERAYPVWISPDGAERAADLADLRLRALQPAPTRLFVLRDAGLPEAHAQSVLGGLRRAGWHLLDLPVGPGEGAKSPEVLAEVWAWLIQHHVRRDDVLIALGGGVVGDLAGFAAATALRGIRCLQLPTTLLAMVDASVGGKTAINVGGAKNLVGAFHQPIGVVCAAGLLNTLPPRELASGLGEVLKYALLQGEDALADLERRAEALQRHDPHAHADLIHACCALKARVVAADEHDRGLRALLNLGHTFGHAIEALAHLQDLAHGAAVALGILLATRAAHLLHLASSDEAEALTRRLRDLCARCGLPTDPSAFLRDPERFAALMAGDKKAQGHHVTLILPLAPGRIVTHPVATEQLQTLLCDLARADWRA